MSSTASTWRRTWSIGCHSSERAPPTSARRSATGSSSTSSTSRGTAKTCRISRAGVGTWKVKGAGNRAGDRPGTTEEPQLPPKATTCDRAFDRSEEEGGVKVLLLNAGSSSLKCTLMESAGSTLLARTSTDWAGPVTRYERSGPGAERVSERVQFRGHGDAV